MDNLLIPLQIVVSLLLIGMILIQSRGTGFGKTFGALPQSFTRRGLEKLVFRITFVLVGIFIVISILQIF
jgi:protein translocase SecG subunit